MDLHEISISTRVYYKEGFVHQLFFRSYELALKILKCAEKNKFEWARALEPTYTIMHNADYRPIVQLSDIANFEKVFTAFYSTAENESKYDSIYKYCSLYSAPDEYKSRYLDMCKDFESIGCKLVSIDFYVGKKSTITFNLHEMNIKKTLGTNISSIMSKEKNYNVEEYNFSTTNDAIMVSVIIPIYKEFFIKQ